MTAYVASTLRSLLTMRRRPWASTARRTPAHAPRPFDSAETLPMLFRSEAFAEDLCDPAPPAA